MNQLIIRLSIVVVLIACAFAWIEYQQINQLLKEIDKQEQLLTHLRVEKEDLLAMPEQKALPINQAIWNLEQFLTRAMHLRNISYSTSFDEETKNAIGNNEGIIEKQLGIYFNNIRDTDDLRRYMTLINEIQSQFSVCITRIEGLKESILLKLSIIGGEQ